MTDFPALDDDYWRDQLFRRIKRAGFVNRQIESDDPYPVEPGSDLAGDRDQVPDLFVDTLAVRALKVAVDYLAGVCDVVNSGTHFYAPYPLIRAVLESSTTAVWLLEPDDRSVRVRRLVGLHVHDTNEKKSTHALLPPGVQDTFDHQPGIDRMLRDAGGKLRFPGFTAAIEAVDDSPGDASSMILAWRICSGFSHGLTWATSGLIPQTNREQIGPTLHRAEMAPNYQLVSHLTDTAVRTIERAHLLLETRRTVTQR